MATRPQPLHSLAAFLPHGSFDLVMLYLNKYPINLSIKKERKRIFGDYRPPVDKVSTHRISINGNLNPQHFLVTLLHEIAHMLVFIYFKKNVQPHGAEWKKTFQLVMQPFLDKNLFEPDVQLALAKYISNPAATTCTDANLIKTLATYDEEIEGLIFVEEVELNNWFAIESGMAFQRLSKLRTRYQCKRKQDGRLYLFPALMKVRKLA